MPTGFTGQEHSQSALSLDWITAIDESHGGTAKEYEIYKNNSLLLTTNNGDYYWLETGLNAGQTYTFQIVAVYPDGAKSAKSNTVTLTMDQ